MKKKNIVSLFLVIIFTFSLLSGCSTSKSTGKDTNKEISKDASNDSNVQGIEINEKEVIFTDARNKKITISKNPQKVVVLHISYLDVWCASGGKVVGAVEPVAGEEKPVEGAKGAEIVGSPSAPSLEKVLALQPDLVILHQGFKAQAAMIETLEQNKIQVLALDDELFQDYIRTVRLFTALTGKEELYEKNAVAVKKKVEAVKAKISKEKDQKTALLLLASSRSVTVKTANSMVGEMLKDLGVSNIVSEGNGAPGETQTFSMEKVIEKDPDFIFMLTMGSDTGKINERITKDAESNPAWASLKAVKNKKYIQLPKDLYMYRPNDKYAEAYENLAKIIYPDIFK